jgi:hypothetical protein
MQQHPYIQYESSPQWQILNKAVDELMKNGDIQLSTAREYIIGYLCQALAAK